MEVSRDEVYRYLGYRGIVPDEAVRARVEECLERVLSVSECRFAARRLDVVFPEEGVCDFGEMRVCSRDLARNLTGCVRAYLMVATIGIGVDRLIARANVSDVTAAAIYQAAGAAVVEAWSDEVNGKLLAEAREDGLFGRPRFSPGYGDFSLEHQRDFSRILGMPRIGISLSESLLMTPSKSVTAVIGLSETDHHCQVTGCEACDLGGDCAFRRV
ncbi:MAG: Vitamin B12 dependent methionine synthase activation subunit [Lachnospiraceae bacterium]|nr:Vitamin B12 dependent methionine synthase activation subunit [Lachnospiraceae bacterium]